MPNECDEDVRFIVSANEDDANYRFVDEVLGRLNEEVRAGNLSHFSVTKPPITSFAWAGSVKVGMADNKSRSCYV